MTYFIESLACFALLSALGQAVGLWIDNQRNRRGIFL